MLEYRLARTVAEFWRRAGDPGPFPRDIFVSAEWALNLAVCPVVGLGERTARRWLEKKGLPAGELDAETGTSQAVRGARRGLHGCLIAFGGRGFILVEANDPPEEARFTIAHEAAHFMLDYVLPRERALAVSKSAADLVDGMRRPTAAERVAAAVSAVDFGQRAWLFARDAIGRSLCSAVGSAELDADRVAFALLAPVDDTLATIAGLRNGATTEAIVASIAARFGVPVSAAGRYLRQLTLDGDVDAPASDWLTGLRGSG